MLQRRVLQPTREAGSVLIVALLLMVLLSLLGVTLLTLAGTEQSVAYNALWSEGSLMAAEAGVNRGINQISANADASAMRFPDSDSPGASIGIGPAYAYRSGKKAARNQLTSSALSRAVA